MWGQKRGWPLRPPSTVQLGTTMGTAWGRGDRGRAAVLRGPCWSLHGSALLDKLPSTPFTAAAFVGSG